MIKTTVRYKTGQVCPSKGNYRFDGYTDGTWTPSPTAEEMVIPLDAGDVFPPINSSDKGAWWKFIG
jgi:hypothetical protein